MTTGTEPLPATARPRRPIAAWAIGAVIVVAILALARPIWRLLGPAPELAPAFRDASAGRWPQAEARLRAYLDYDPSDVAARLKLADVYLSREPAQPERAIEQLDAVRTKDRARLAESHMLRGKALMAQGHFGRAEREWLEARRLDPQVGEAGWMLLNLYYIEGRNDAMRALALRLHRVEPDPIDRVRVLIEAMRPDAEPLASAGVIPMFKATVQADPDDIYPALAYYRSLAKDGTGIAEAVEGLRGLVARHPDDPACLDGLLFALITVADLDAARKVLEGLPPGLAADRRFVRHRGRLAEASGDGAQAIRDYREVLAGEPSDQETVHRLGETYRLMKNHEEEAKAKARWDEIEAARIELRGIKGRETLEGRIGLFEEAVSRPELGVRPDPDFAKRVASVRERMGHAAEALAWYRIALAAAPDDAESRAAVDRLAKPRPK